ncbi:MAG: histidine phosphatase family protein [Phycisphaerales bacterium]|nr:histidine phosphatase family protein [Phycisphaerales bacterium]
MSTRSSPNALRRLLLVRHGLPDYRGGHAGDLWPGPPLSPIGRIQAAQAAEVIAPLEPLTVYASPLARTWQTAEIIARTLGQRPRAAPDLREWHRCESLHEVAVRLSRWLVAWLRSDEPCAVAVSHASPLLAVLRSALYLPHAKWHRTGQPNHLEVSSADRFEVSMASVFELTIERDRVAARCLFHPTPRVQHAVRGGHVVRLPRPVVGHGEATECVRPGLLHLVGGPS